MTRTSRSATIVHLFASLAPVSVDVDDASDLRGALADLEVAASAEAIVRAGYGAGGLAGVLALVVGTVVGLPVLVTAPVAFAVLVGVAHAVHELPGVLAAVRRRRALGRAPDLVARIALRLQVEPALEPAVAFAVAASDEGPSTGGERVSLPDALAAEIRRTGRGDRALLAFADAHADDAPGLRRACHLLASAPDAPDADRGRRIDRAFAAVLDGTRDRLREYTTGLSGPVNALYAFGVLLPLALVAVLPAAAAAGLPASLPVVVAVYDGLLPCSLLAATAWVLANRPVAFPPPRVPRDHPAVPARRWPALVVGAFAGLAVAGLVFAFGPTASGGLVPTWLAPVLGVGIGAGVAAHRLTSAADAVRERALGVEEGLVDAAYAVGRRVANGDAVEDALAAGADVPGEAGEAFAAAVGVQRRLGVAPRAAFLGEHGAVADLPSERVRAVLDLLALAAAQGAPAGQAVVAVADHLEDLAAVERACRDDLATVTSTLRSTGRGFGPLVGGATVALADGLATPTSLLGNAPSAGIDPGALGLAVGAYVLALAGILAALAVVLEAGVDRVAVGRELSKALPTAACAFAAGVVLTGALV